MSLNEWTTLIIPLFGITLGSNVISALITTRSNRKLEDDSHDNLLEQTSKMMIYIVMTMKIEMILNQKYATPQERNEMNELHSLYKLWGWNGDMDSRIAKIYQLPTKPIHNRRSADTK